MKRHQQPTWQRNKWKSMCWTLMPWKFRSPRTFVTFCSPFLLFMSSTVKFRKHRHTKGTHFCCQLLSNSLFCQGLNHLNCKHRVYSTSYGLCCTWRQFHFQNPDHLTEDKVERADAVTRLCLIYFLHSFGMYTLVLCGVWLPPAPFFFMFISFVSHISVLFFIQICHTHSTHSEKMPVVQVMSSLLLSIWSCYVQDRFLHLNRSEVKQHSEGTPLHC